MSLTHSSMRNIVQRAMIWWISTTIVLLAGTLLLYNNTIQNSVSLHQKDQQTLILEIQQIIKARLDLPKRDVFYLANQYAIQHYLTTGEEQDKTALINTFKTFMDSRLGIYFQVRYIDETGQEIIRIETNNNRVEVVDNQRLQNKSDRYYFLDTQKLAPDSIYVSPLDLNVEHGQVQIPYTPVMRFGARVFDSSGVGRGVIIINYLGEPLLNRLKALIPQNSSIEFWLLNHDGYWLSNPSNEREWGFMFADRKGQQLPLQHPELWQQLLSAKQPLLQTQWNGGLLTAGQFHGENEFDEANLSLANNHNIEWHLLAWMPKEQLSRYSRPLFYRFSITFGIVSLLLGAIFMLIGRLNYSRRQTEAQVREVNQRSAIATRAAGIGIWEYQMHDQSLSWDMQMYNIYQLDPKDFSGAYDAWQSAVHPEDLERASTALEAAIRGEQSFDIEFRIIAPSGEVRWVKANAEVIRDSSGNALKMIGTNIDISEKERHAKEIEKAQKDAERMAKSKSEFLANMSHEIRTPMNAIIGLSHLGLGLPDISPVLHDYLTKIHTSSRALLIILNDILDLSKVEAGRLELESEEFDPEAIMANVVDLFCIRAEEKEIEMVLSMSPDIPAGLLGDSLRLGQILNNLVGNAIKFTDSGQIVLKVELLPNTTTSEKVTIEFSVQDTGIGMNKDQLSHLFEAFQQGDGSISRRFGGTGLGLTISKKLVEKMGGQLSVVSEPNQGSTFSFTIKFPIVKHQRFDSSKLKLRGMHVLVVDDIDASRLVLADLLKSWKFDVVEAPSGAEAIEQLIQAASVDNPFELILLDWKMPKMDGITAAQRIHNMVEQQILPKLPVIMMVTAYNKEDLLREIHGIHLDAILTKPVAPSHMFDVIMNVQGGKVTENLSHHHPNLYEQAHLIHGAHILLVEDNEINQTVANDILTRMGLRVTIAENGQQALDLLTQTTFDIVLMDLQMPVMDGFEASRRIRQQLQLDSLPIVAMTAAVMIGDREACAAAGMNDHVSKPIEPEHLLQTLIRWVKPQITYTPLPSPSVPPPSNLMPHTPVHAEIHGINIQQALARLDNNLKLFHSLLKQACAKYSEMVLIAQREYLAGKHAESTRLLHTLRGVLGNIGALDAAEKLQQLEAAINEGADEKVNSRFPQQVQAINRLFQSIQDYLHNIDPESGSAAENPVQILDQAALIKLYALLQEQEASALDDYESLRPAIEHMLDQSTNQQLRDAMDNLQFTDAAAILHPLIEAP